jgi:hypothetical protein
MKKDIRHLLENKYGASWFKAGSLVRFRSTLAN